MTLFAIAMLCALWMLWVLLPGTTNPHKNLVFAGAGDDADMKIAPESFSAVPKDEAAVHREAEEFLRQKSAGNIRLARQLGERYATLLLNEVSKNFDPWPTELAPELAAHHRLLLLTYVVNRVVGENSPNSILAQTTLNVFSGELEDKAPQLDKYIRDTASYSLYVLHERNQGADSEVGKIFAGLCADKDNTEVINQGNRYYREYYTLCKELHDQTQYTQV